MAVQFDEQDFGRPNPIQQRKKKGGVTKLIMKTGLAKNDKQANMVMLVIAVIAVGVAVFLLWPESGATPTATPMLDDPMLAP